MQSKSKSSELARVEKLILRIPESGCWLWVGAKNRKGYGVLGRGPRGKAKHFYAHRYVYELLSARIPSGMQLDHLCKVECCVNPKHLEPVTLRENVARSEVGRVNRGKTHCPRGHEYAGANLAIGQKGDRVCRICKTNWTRQWRIKKKLVEAIYPIEITEIR